MALFLNLVTENYTTTWDYNAINGNDSKFCLKQSALARLENRRAIPRLDTLYKVVRALGMEFKLVVAEEEEAAAI